MTYDDHHDRDVIVEREGTGIGTVLGILLAVIIVLAIVWFFFLGGMGDNSNPPADQNQDTQVEINPNPPADQPPPEQPPAP